MEQAVEWFVAITALAVGTSHALRPDDWADAFRRLADCGRPGALVNGGLSLATGAFIVAGHHAWAWPGAPITGFGWLLIVKGSACLLAPDRALRSMKRGGDHPRAFIAGGALALAVGGWACFCLWHRS